MERRKGKKDYGSPAHRHFAFLPTHASYPYADLPRGKKAEEKARLNDALEDLFAPLLYQEDTPETVKLPISLWRKVLNYRIADSKSWSVAARLMLVCRSWHSIVWSLPRKIDFTTMPPSYFNVIIRNTSEALASFTMDKGDDVTVPAILLCFSALNSLELLHCEALTDKGTRKLSSLKELSHLGFGWCPQITDTTLRRVASLPSLTHFSLSRCPGITRTGLAALVSVAATLERLTFSHCDELVDTDFAFLPSLTNLKSIHISFCHGVTGSICGLLPASLLELQLHECQNLNSLTALIPVLPTASSSSSSSPVQPPALTRIDISGSKLLRSEGVRVLSSFPSLHSLRIAFTLITDDAIPSIAALTGLTSLDLTYADVTDKSVSTLSTLTGLTTLDLGLTGITDESLPSLVSYFPRLTTLCLFRCKKIKGTGFSSEHTTLTRLDLGHCVSLMDEGVVALSNAFPSLRTLNLAGCKEVTRASMKTLPTSLTTLNLSGCKVARPLIEWHDERRRSSSFSRERRDSKGGNETSNSISGGEGGEKEGMKECVAEDDDRLIGFVERLVHLQELHLYKVGNAHIRELAGYPCATTLRHLHLVESKDVNDAGLSFILALRELRELHAKDCRKLSVSGLPSLKALPHLRVLHLPHDKVVACGKKLVALMDSLRIVGL